MKILLAPSETKQIGGDKLFKIDSLLFRSLTSNRLKLIHLYTAIIQKKDIQVLSKMFGLKKEKDILRYKQDITYQGTMKAIQRYTGVAFDYLDYNNLDINSQKYIDNNIIIFSNLFGAIRANDLIPDYKLKQGEKIGDIKVHQFYKEYTAKLLDYYLKDEEILDLRSLFYNKFYTPNRNFTTIKFIKNNKVISHWAKAYRGILLHQMAINKTDTIDKLIKLDIKNIKLVDIEIKKLKREIIYKIE